MSGKEWLCIQMYYASNHAKITINMVIFMKKVMIAMVMMTLIKWKLNGYGHCNNVNIIDNIKINNSHTKAISYLK